MTSRPVHLGLTPGPRDFFWRGRNFSYIVACIPALSIIPTSQDFAIYVGSQDMRGSATHRLRLILQRGFCDPRLIPPAMAAPPCPATGTAWTATQGLRPRTPTGKGAFRRSLPAIPSTRPGLPDPAALRGGAAPRRGAFRAPLWTPHRARGRPPARRKRALRPSPCTPCPPRFTRLHTTACSASTVC